MKSVIVTGGSLQPPFLKSILDQNAYDLVICADSGANAMYLGGRVPHVLLGDFDSIREDVMAHFNAMGVEKMTYPAEKDATDTEIAMDYAIEKGATEITLLGGTGSRLDHTLSNILLIQRYMGRATCILLDAHNRIQLFEGPKTISLNKMSYDFISLLPLTQTITGVTNQGFKYPLHEATLYRDSSRGISNQLLGSDGTIHIETGLSAVIWSRD